MPQPGTCPVIYSRERRCWRRCWCRRWSRTACSSPDRGSSHRAVGSSQSTEEEWWCRGGQPLTGWSSRCRAHCVGGPGGRNDDGRRESVRQLQLQQVKLSSGDFYFILLFILTDYLTTECCWARFCCLLPRLQFGCSTVHHHQHGVVGPENLLLVLRAAQLQLPALSAFL